MAAEFESLGLAPLGADSSRLLPVRLRYSEVDAAGTTLEFTGPSGSRILEPTLDYLVHADKTRDSVDLSGDVLFVGWGVTAPEWNYDDYRGLDVTGKIVALVFGGPQSVPPDERGHFASLGVKERNAYAHGAIGVVTIMPAPGPQLARSLGQLEGFDWPDEQGRARSPFFEAGVVVRLTDRGTAALFGAAGRSFPEVAAELAKGPVSFPITASLHLRARFRHRPVTVSNTAAVLEGSDPRLKHEYIVYSAHMDHIGVNEPVDGDSVYHGAIDNAGGTATMMAVARAFASGPRPAAAAFAPIQAIGGDTGWYGWDGLWRLRGLLDLLVGGVGMRRGRPYPALLRVGDTVDFWRVEALEPNRRLRLAAEMKVPGRAWLEFEVVEGGPSTTIRQTAIFDPVGWFGRLYWYALFPLHQLVFGGMLLGIAREAVRASPEVHG